MDVIKNFEIDIWADFRGIDLFGRGEKIVI